jgi:NAD(P)-dependent dehydrogenase (short-subunit alcohol dehydrogenase family)
MLGISLEGQVGVVTGAGTPFGIGRSMVLAAARAGARAVYACDLSISAVPALVEDVQLAGLECTIIGHFLDVSSQDQTVALLKDIIRTYGRLDFFFANAGYAMYRSVAVGL